MITRQYRIDDMGEIHITMDFAPEFTKIGMDCLSMVLMTKPLTDMRNRTPLATLERYDYYVHKDGERVRTRKGRYGEYGNLRKAAIRDPVRKVNENTLTFGAYANGKVPYVSYVHEAIKPREGSYWQMGMLGRGRGWTTPGTGNRFVSRAVENNADYIAEKTVEQFDLRLSEAGL